MPSEKIFSSNEIDAYFSKGSSDFLLITFSAISFKPVLEIFWGERFCQKNDISVIGFVSRTGTNWYPRKDMENAAKQLDKITREYKNIITYGSSMGAYGALKHSNLLNASACAAFGPQFSIDPQEIDNLSFSRFYRPEINEKMAIKKNDICNNAFVFYDPHCEFDKISANTIAKESPNTRLIKIPFAGHECIKVIAGSSQTINLLRSCLQGDYHSVTQQARAANKVSPARYAGLAEHVVSKRPKLALKILENSPQPLDKKQVATFYHQAALAEFNKKNFDEAEKYSLKSIKILPDRTGFIRRLATIYAYKNEVEKAISCLNQVLAIDPNDSSALFSLANLSFRKKDLLLANTLIDKAVNLIPDKSQYIRLSELIKKEIEKISPVSYR